MSNPAGTTDQQLIPHHLHFIWFGARLPDFAQIAIASALEKNPAATATLWHDDNFEDVYRLADLRARGMRLRLIAPETLFAATAEKDPTLPVDALRGIYAQLKTPASKANVIRMLALYVHGGVYLDTDTFTLKSLRPLLSQGAFCGEEPTLWPAGTALLNPRALLMGEVRRACSYLPFGYRLHNRLLGSYTMAANNAVLGARAGHPFIAAMLRNAAQLSASERLRRFRLGTHLLQKTLRTYVPATAALSEAMNVMPTRHFYPLGPEISRHYFAPQRDPARVAQELLAEDTYVIHWYGSVSDLMARDAHFIRKTAARNVYSHLCQAHVRSRAPEQLGHAVPSLA